MDYTIDTGYIELYPEMVEEEIVTYAQSWTEEYQSIAQKIVDAYLLASTKTEIQLTEEDVEILDEMVFEESHLSLTNVYTVDTIGI